MALQRRFRRTATIAPLCLTVAIALLALRSGKSSFRQSDTEPSLVAVALCSTAITVLAAPQSRRVLVGGTASGDVRVWSIDEGLALHPLWVSGVGSASVSALAVSGDGSSVVAAHLNRGITVFRLDDGALVQRFNASDLPIQALAISDDNRYVLSVDRSRGAAIRKWNVATGSQEEILGFCAGVRDVAFGDDRACLTIDSMGIVRAWNSRETLAPLGLPPSILRTTAHVRLAHAGPLGGSLVGSALIPVGERILRQALTYHGGEFVVTWSPTQAKALSWQPGRSRILFWNAPENSVAAGNFSEGDAPTCGVFVGSSPFIGTERGRVSVLLDR